MNIKVNRKAKKLWHSEWKDAITHAASWACKELGIQDSNATVEFKLKWDPSEDYAGLALTMKPFSRFVIILNGVFATDDGYIFRTIFHELTHVKQEIHEGLFFDDITEAHFRGMVYKFANEAEFGEHYWNLPWEVEAREMEKILGDKYAKLFG